MPRVFLAPCYATVLIIVDKKCKENFTEENAAKHKRRIHRKYEIIDLVAFEKQPFLLCKKDRNKTKRVLSGSAKLKKSEFA